MVQVNQRTEGEQIVVGDIMSSVWTAAQTCFIIFPPFLIHTYHFWSCSIMSWDLFVHQAPHLNPKWQFHVLSNWWNDFIQPLIPIWNWSISSTWLIMSLDVISDDHRPLKHWSVDNQHYFQSCTVQNVKGPKHKLSCVESTPRSSLRLHIIKLWLSVLLHVPSLLGLFSHWC